MAHEPTGTVTTESTRRWRDRKRYLWLIGLIVPSFAFVAIGVYLAFRVLDFPDLTVDGSFPLGAAVAAVLIIYGLNAWVATAVAMVAGAAAGGAGADQGGATPATSRESQCRPPFRADHGTNGLPLPHPHQDGPRTRTRRGGAGGVGGGQRTRCRAQRCARRRPRRDRQPALRDPATSRVWTRGGRVPSTSGSVRWAGPTAIRADCRSASRPR